MNRTAKIVKRQDRKDAAVKQGGVKIDSRLDEIEKARRIAQGLLKVLDKLHAEEVARVQN